MYVNRAGTEGVGAATEEVQEFWRHIFAGDHGLIQVWTGVRGSDGEINKETIVSKCFDYPRAAETAAEWALEKSKEGREVYFCAHLLTAPRRIKKNAAEVHALWVETDGVALPDGNLRPTAVIESSPGRYHGYQRLTDAIPPQVAEGLNLRYAHAIGADPSGADLTQLLRLPGTVNHKYPERPIVKILELDPARAYSPGELDRELPQAKSKKSHRQTAAPAVEPRIPAGRRNEELTSLAGTMRRRGLGEEEMFAALAVANRKRCQPPLEEQEVRRIAASVARYAPANYKANKGFKEIVYGDGERPANMPYNTTDMGNAERLAARHGEDLRYIHAWGKWLEYDGTRWRVDDTGGVGRRAKETTRYIYGEAEKTEYAELRQELARHAIKSEARSRIEAMIALAQSEPGIPVRYDDLDADSWLLNVENGTVDLRTGELRKHRREDLITKCAPVKYFPDIESPTWKAVLERLLPSEELRTFFQRFVGYCLTGDVSEQVLVFLHGLGANGKSTIINALLDTLGDYGRQAAPELLTVKGNSHPTELADLKGARLVASIEVEEGKRLAESLVKQLTGGDRIKARRMREDFWEFEATHKILFAANHKPVVHGADHAIWRRIKLVPFEVTIPDHEKDKKLPDKLRAERSGILAWAVRGCLDWQENGLGEPEEVRAATDAYRAEMDVLATFMEECCVVHVDAHAGATPLYSAYKKWCESAGEHEVSQTRFGTMLGERGFTPGKDPKTRRRTWSGIGLRIDNGPDDGGGGASPENPPYSFGTKQSKQFETVETTSPREADKTPGEQNNCFAPPATVSQDASERDVGTLGTEEAGDAIRRASSGPAKALATYLAKPNAERLMYLTCAILRARGMETDEWEAHVDVVEEAAGNPSNHPLGCGCAECL